MVDLTWYVLSSLTKEIDKSNKNLHNHECLSKSNLFTVLINFNGLIVYVD